MNKRYEMEKRREELITKIVESYNKFSNLIILLIETIEELSAKGLDATIIDKLLPNNPEKKYLTNKELRSDLWIICKDKEYQKELNLYKEDKKELPPTWEKFLETKLSEKAKRETVWRTQIKPYNDEILLKENPLSPPPNKEDKRLQKYENYFKKSISKLEKILFSRKELKKRLKNQLQSLEEAKTLWQLEKETGIERHRILSTLKKIYFPLLYKIENKTYVDSALFNVCLHLLKIYWKMEDNYKGWIKLLREKFSKSRVSHFIKQRIEKKVVPHFYFDIVTPQKKLLTCLMGKRGKKLKPIDLPRKIWTKDYLSKEEILQFLQIYIILRVISQHYFHSIKKDLYKLKNSSFKEILEYFHRTFPFLRRMQEIM